MTPWRKKSADEVYAVDAALEGTPDDPRFKYLKYDRRDAAACAAGSGRRAGAARRGRAARRCRSRRRGGARAVDLAGREVVEHRGPRLADRRRLLAVGDEAQRGLRVDVERRWFYSDSINDLPLLEAVTDPVAVDPDPPLRAQALAKGWPIMKFL